jgi:HD-like signal output (HDOD) protein
MSPIAMLIKKDLERLIEADKLKLPSLPDIVMDVRSVLRDVKKSSTDLARIISRDPAIAAQIIKAANNPAIRASSLVTDIISAVNRLGIDVSCNLTTGLAVSQMFQANTKLIDKKMKSIWAENIQVAGFAEKIARAKTKLKPDVASLGGLICSIGALPVLTYLDEKVTELADAEIVDEIIREIQGLLGERILTLWDFAPELAVIPNRYRDFSYQSQGLDYSALVQVASILFHRQYHAQIVDYEAIDSLQQLGVRNEEEMKAFLELLSQQSSFI